MPPAPTSVPASPTFVSQPQRGNPRGIRARATDHAVRRFAERAVGVIVDEGMDDTSALAELIRRGVNVRRVRQTLSKLGGIGVGKRERLRSTMAGAKAGWIRQCPKEVRREDGRIVTAFHPHLTSAGIAGLAEHFCRGAQATRQPLIPGV
ncbi:hypothetical protein ABID82_001697 [Methylobacterium sp. PvP062]|uniref:Uncharacterized protein n=3 Tax=Methylobacteriaceae TaxID=119045 RepID=A0A509EHN2_9HYPH|nr:MULTISPECIES: hypothetical protein [unclassified Methylobacterium]MBP2492901.1 hypothetical protein [Methylobacterium sp. PvP105]MBP2500727.1 hypothetical protein [Methylobacterium sp. PvP109]MWV21471.1 hypothetical protein [Methylobacterium sp. 2A]VUD73886.1 hypothetical protein MET9862_04508 [Methylobacterium symbioticum]